MRLLFKSMLANSEKVMSMSPSTSLDMKSLTWDSIKVRKLLTYLGLEVLDDDVEDFFLLRFCMGQP